MPDVARLYLITPVLDAADAFAPDLAAALRTADAACVLLRTRPGDDRLRRQIATALAPVVQERGAACLLEDDTRIAGAVGADGVHVLGAGDALAQALRSLKPHGIVGAGGLATRDDAMLAGEAGADYLLFGDPIEGAVPPFGARLDRVAWWAEIFEVPCVAWAHTLDEVEPLASAGADFVALADAAWTDPRGIEPAMRDVVATLKAVALRRAAEAAQ
jgi:thiamine-phosphate pyrophosphorylase